MPLDSQDLRFSPPAAPERPRSDTSGVVRINLDAQSQDPSPPSEIAFDPVAAEADATFAGLGAKAALQAALESARSSQSSQSLQSLQARSPVDRDPSADWTPEMVRSGQALHALLGVDDPLLLGAEGTYDDTAMDQQLRDALSQLPHIELASGELAALDAFDFAMGEGADVEEALSAAIAAAEASAGPEWAAPPDSQFLSPTPDLTPELELNQRSPEAPFELAVAEGPSSAGGQAANPAFDVRIDASSAYEGGLDPAFGVGFDFGPQTGDEELLLDFQRRLFVERDSERRDSVVTATAASSADLQGTSAADLLAGGSGQDNIGALSGDDYLYGDTPTNLNTAVHNASSPLTNPTFSATGAADAMSGGAGDDSLWGGAGADRMHGDIPDTGSSLADEFGFDLGAAGFGDDALWGGEGADSLWGGAGNDTLYGEAGTDSLYGGDGNDVLYGGDGADRLEGNAGVDTLYGQAGADNLFGYAGDDVVAGGEGDDTLAGGDGADEFQFTGGSGADALAHAQSLGTDTISDYSAAAADTLGLSDGDFGFGTSGNLAAGDTYFEFAQTSLSATPLDAGGGDAGPAVVIFGAGSGTDGVDVYYTDDASAMTNANSYQIADIIGVNMTDVEAGDFFLRS
ncbi:MAG: hypothetical protein HOH04_08855 [Rhodospirillaceae bacterium]|nr:hypothetical protein [Rhodospirillaceae bacterium]